eukprot:PhM_4_TR12288/c0_g1_i1/m.56357/K14652/ribBA; 3,4-dihydroxy 2-butanone 4-phosphate synthase / GTP cyclohydrolase II
MNSSSIAQGALSGAVVAGAILTIAQYKASGPSRRPRLADTLSLMCFGFDSVQTAIEAFRSGTPVIVVDDNAESEGDIFIPACMCTEEHIAHALRHTTGILCVPMPDEVATRLALPPMTTLNQPGKTTAFTVSTDLKFECPSKGISARDRAATVRALADPKAEAMWFNRPGHVFPLRARRGGVAERRGHTEAAVDLCRLASIDPPVAVIAGLMDKDGSLMRQKDSFSFARAHKYPVITVESLVAYVQRHPLIAPLPHPSVLLEAECQLPICHNGVDCGTWTMQCYRFKAEKEYIALTYGDYLSHRALVRVHSECFTGDILGSLRCDCGEQLHLSLTMIHKNNGGVFLYLTGHEGRGTGLSAKVKAYANQHDGIVSEDLRSFDPAIAILKFLGLKRFSLLTNSSLKLATLAEHFEHVLEHPLPSSRHPHKTQSEKKTREGQKRNETINAMFYEMAIVLEDLCAELNLYEADIRIGLVRLLWHDSFASRLREVIIKHVRSRVKVTFYEVVVPGLDSMPYGASALAQSDVDLVLCLGVLLPSDYPPPNYLGRNAALSAMGIAFASDVPVLYGVLTCHDERQLDELTKPESEVARALALSAIHLAVQYQRDPAIEPSVPFRFSPQASEVTSVAPPSRASFGTLDPYEDMNVAVLYAEYSSNPVFSVVERLEEELKSLGVKNIAKVRVPGMLELAREVYLSRQRGFDVALCVGVLEKSEVNDVYVNIILEASTRMLSSLPVSYQLECDTPTVNCMFQSGTDVDDLVPYWARSAVYLATVRQVRYPKLASHLSPRQPDVVAPPERKPLRVGIVRTHGELVHRLRDRCVDLLAQDGTTDVFDIVVPDLFQLPHAAHILSRGDVDAVLCLALSIPEGPLKHMSRACIDALVELQLTSGVGVAIGVIPCKDLETAASLPDDTQLIRSLVDAVHFLSVGCVRKNLAPSIQPDTIPPHLRLPVVDSMPPLRGDGFIVCIVTTLTCCVALKRHLCNLKESLRSLGVADCDILVEHVPTIMEMKYTLQEVRGRVVDVIVCLGAVVQDPFDSFRLNSEGCTSQLEVQTIGDVPIVCAVNVVQDANEIDDAMQHLSGLAEAAVHMAHFRRWAVGCGLAETNVVPLPPATMQLTKVHDSEGSDHALTHILLPANTSTLRIGVVKCAWLSQQQRVVLDAIWSVLTDYGIREKNIHETTVPTVMDLGLGASMLLENQVLDVAICLGLTVAGGVLSSCDHRTSPPARGIDMCRDEFTVPVVSAVLATPSQHDSSERAAASGPWGRHVALAALHMVGLSQRYASSVAQEQHK